MERLIKQFWGLKDLWNHYKPPDATSKVPSQLGAALPLGIALFLNVLGHMHDRWRNACRKLLIAF